MSGVMRPLTTRNRRNASELLFEHYLRTLNISFEYESRIAGKLKCPDYRIVGDDQVIFCEVKELREKRPRPRGAVVFNPYAGIRKKIDEARKQFREYRDHACVLVIHNVDDWEFRSWPYVLFGAMLGDFGIQMPFDQRRGVILAEQRRPAFLDGGRMVDPKSRRPQNTTISAIALLSEFTIPNPEFEREIEGRTASLKSGLGCEPSSELRLEVRMALYGQLPLTLGNCPRIEVFENPVARIKLPKHAFYGMYDARFEYTDRLRQFVRVYAGDGLKRTEVQARSVRQSDGTGDEGQRER